MFESNHLGIEFPWQKPVSDINFQDYTIRRRKMVTFLSAGNVLSLAVLVDNIGCQIRES